MRGNILFICLAVFLQTNLFAQMQGLISYSSERYSRAIQPESNTVVVENYTDDTIITLCTDNNNTSYFCKIALNSSAVEYGVMPSGIEIYDFKIYGNDIIMCGKNTNTTPLNPGFIGVININDLFAGIGILQCHSVGHSNTVYDMEYYIDINGHLKVAALATTRPSGYIFVDYDLSTSTTHYIYPTQYTLYRLTQTKNYIAIVFSEPNATEFGIIRHDKANIFNYQSQIWQFAGGNVYSSFGLVPENRGTYFLIEDIEGTDEVCVVGTIRNHPGYIAGVPIVVYNIDVSNFNLNSTQVIQSYGKTKLKDMEYIPTDQTLHIINNTDLYYNNNGNITYKFNIDLVNKIDVYPINLPYTAEVIIPSNSLEYNEYINSIIRYSDNYYIIGGKSSSFSSLYWFDRKYSNSNDQCYRSYGISVVQSNAFSAGNMTYSYYPHMADITNISCPGVYNTLWFSQCID